MAVLAVKQLCAELQWEENINSIVSWRKAHFIFCKWRKFQGQGASKYTLEMRVTMWHWRNKLEKTFPETNKKQDNVMKTEENIKYSTVYRHEIEHWIAWIHKRVVKRNGWLWISIQDIQRHKWEHSSCSLYPGSFTKHKERLG